MGDAALLDSVDNLGDNAGIALNVSRAQRGIACAHDEHTPHERVAHNLSLQVDLGLEAIVATQGLKCRD